MQGRTREEILALATQIHDEEMNCHCDRKYLMSCVNMTLAILETPKRPLHE